jgi:hypothetical protein
MGTPRRAENLPPALEGLFWQDVTQYEEEKRMPFVTTGERIGIRKGLLEGIQVCLKMKFGEEGLQLMPELRSIHDEEKLRAVLGAIEAATTVDDVRRAWSE